MVVRNSIEACRLRQRFNGLSAKPAQAACATKSMEKDEFDLAGQEGIIVVRRGNIACWRWVASLIIGGDHAVSLSGIASMAMNSLGESGLGLYKSHYNLSCEAGRKGR